MTCRFYEDCLTKSLTDLLTTSSSTGALASSICTILFVLSLVATALLYCCNVEHQFCHFSRWSDDVCGWGWRTAPPFLTFLCLPAIARSLFLQRAQRKTIRTPILKLPLFGTHLCTPYSTLFKPRCLPEIFLLRAQARLLESRTSAFTKKCPSRWRLYRR